MKRLFRKRWFAIALCVIVVIGTTLLNTRVKFGAKCDKAVNAFYQDANHSSLSEGLNAVVTCGDGLTAIAGHYNLDNGAATTSNEALRLAVQTKYDGPAFLYYLYQNDLTALGELVGRLGQTSMTERDAASFEQYTAQLESERSAVTEAQSDYNQETMEFLREYRRFPTELLAAMVGLDYPELFG